MRDPLRVIEAIDPDDEGAARHASSTRWTNGNRSERWARRAKAAVSMPTGKTSIRIVRSPILKLKSMLCKPHSRVDSG